jgi:hypothetical protein
VEGSRNPHRRRGPGIVAVAQHEAPRFLQPQPLLVLQRAHRCELPEVVMQARPAHLHTRNQFFDAQWLRGSQSIARATRWLWLPTAAICRSRAA